MAEFETFHIKRDNPVQPSDAEYRPLPCGGFEVINPDGTVDRHPVVSLVFCQDKEKPKDSPDG